MDDIVRCFGYSLIAGLAMVIAVMAIGALVQTPENIIKPLAMLGGGITTAIWIRTWEG